MHPRGLVGRSAKYPNRGKPFPSRRPLFQSEAKCEAIDMKIFFILIQIKLIFQERSCTQPSNESERFWNSEIAPQQRSRPLVYLDYSLSITLSHYWQIMLVILSFTFMCPAFTWTQWKPCFLMQFPRNLKSSATSDTKRRLRVSYAASRS